MRLSFRRLFSTSVSEGLTITPRCAQHIKSLGDQSFLRVLVDAGGCGGFQYRFEVEKAREEDDVVFEKDGSQVVVDPTSLEYLKGAIVDYEVSMMSNKFTILENPLAEANCGCGVSFSPKM